MQDHKTTFRVTITSQEHHSWQGILEYGDREYSFLSALDLIRMMDSFLNNSKGNTEAEE